MYDILLLIHVLAAMAWVGGGFLMHVTLRLVRRARGQEAADRLLVEFSWADDWLAVAGPILVLGTGLAMVLMSAGWKFSQEWVYLSLGLLILYEGLAGTVGAGLYRQITDARGEERVGTPDFGVVLARFTRFGTVMLSLLVTVVVLMVFRPGV